MAASRGLALALACLLACAALTGARELRQNEDYAEDGPSGMMMLSNIELPDRSSEPAANAALARFLESREDHTAVEAAAAAARHNAAAAAEAFSEHPTEQHEQHSLLVLGGAGSDGMESLAAAAAAVGLGAHSGRSVAGTAAAPVEATEADSEADAAVEAADRRRAAVARAWATTAMDVVMRETAAALDALEAQQQQVVAALQQHQARAAVAAASASSGASPCPHKLAVLAARARSGDAFAAARVAAALQGRPVAAALGPTFLSAHLSADGPAADAVLHAVAGAEEETPAPAEAAAIVGPSDSEPASDCLMMLLLSAACAATVVAFMNALVQLRTAMAANDSSSGGSNDYLFLGAEDFESDVGEKLKAYRPESV